jgi:hypothetical protein
VQNRPPVVRPPARPVRPVEQGATAADVEAMIAKAKDFLYKAQAPDGGFEGVPARPPVIGAEGVMALRNDTSHGGASALAVYALLAAGEPETDPRLAKGIKYLKSIDIKGTYPLGLRSLVWYQLSLFRDPKDRKTPAAQELLACANHDARLLLQGMGDQGESLGLYTYSCAQPAGHYDHSCANYGTMGVWACRAAGADVPPKYWQFVQDAWRRHQLRDGSWMYHGGPNEAGVDREGTLSMTTGGLVNLFITQEILDPNKTGDCKGNVVNPGIEAGINWVADHTRQMAGNGGFSAGYPEYTLFNLVRVGRESGYQRFGDFDWFQAGADYLLRRQAADGSFGFGGGQQGVSNTAFGLAFLALGRAPVVLNKLEYGPDVVAGNAKAANWNQRPRDAANLTRWLERHYHRQLNWQIVTLRMPLEVLQQAPILYVAGNQELAFPPLDRKVLQDYVEQGGLVVANADCSNKRFAESFMKLGRQIWPGYEFRLATPEHAIHKTGLFPPKARPPQVWALGNGAREYMVLISDSDPAKQWQQLPQQPALAAAAAAAVPPQRDQAAQLAANLHHYATERGQLRDKKQTHIIKLNPDEIPARKVPLTHLKHDGNWNPEPAGLKHLSAHLTRTHKLALELKTVDVAKEPIETRVAYLTGTEPLKFDEPTREKLRRFGYEGGLLIVDACGGAPDFVESAERELKAIFEQASQELKLDHPVFTVGVDTRTVSYREMFRPRMGNRVTGPPLLKAINKGKIVAFFSPLDMSVALVGHPIDGVHGYAPDSARNLMLNMLLYGLAQDAGKAP